MDLALVNALEERLFNAWPALETIYMDGWLLRFARGHTKRANAASLLGKTTISPEELIREIKFRYRQAGIEPMARLTPLSVAYDAAFAAAGWTTYDPTKVMLASLAERVSMAGDPAAAVVLSEAPSPAWIDGAAEAYELQPWQRDALSEIVSRIRVDAAFATVFLGRKAVGYGLGVAERGYIGLYDLAVHPNARGKGVGKRMIGGLMHWGRSKGAHSAYLQVRAANLGARRLYGELGFKDVYDYVCRRMEKA